MKETKMKGDRALISHLSSLIFYLCLLIILCGCVAEPPVNPNIAPAIDNLIRDHQLENTRLAIKVFTFPYKQIVYEKDADYLMTVASNLKLFTTGVALCRLGPDFEFYTSLYYDKTYNWLIVRSNGDPNISGRFHNGNPTAIFEEWATKLTQLGVKEVQTILLDDRAFDRQYIPPDADWPKDQLSYWYCAPTSAISFNDNCVDITVDSANISLSPTTNYFTLITKYTKGGTKPALSFYRKPATNVVTISGTLPDNGTQKEFVTVDNPALFFGTVLKETFSKNGISIKNDFLFYESDDRQTMAETLIGTVKTPLAQVIAVTNQRSQNFYAEQILKTLGYQVKGKGTFDNGLEVIKDYLATEVKIPTGTYLMADGSGLSKKNWVSAGQVMDLLYHLASHKYSDYFLNSLNNRGWNGTPYGQPDIPNHKNNNLPAGREMRAKTGFIKNTLALSGYALHNSKPKYIFSIVANNFKPDQLDSIKKFQNAVAELLAREE